MSPSNLPLPQPDPVQARHFFDQGNAPRAPPAHLSSPGLPDHALRAFLFFKNAFWLA